MKRKGHDSTTAAGGRTGLLIAPQRHAGLRQRVEETLSQWFDSLRAPTARDYRESLRGLAKVAAAEGYPAHDATTFGIWAVESPELFTSWMQAYLLDERRGAPATRRKRSSTVGRMLKALRRARLPAPSWSPELPSRGSGRGHAPVADTTWAVQAEAGDGLLELRTRAMLALAACGLKTAEIRALRFPDAIDHMPLLRVDEDRVPVSPETWAAIQRWVDRRGTGAGWLFLDLDGRSERTTDQQVSARSMQRGARKLGQSLSSVRRRRILDEAADHGVRHAAVVARVNNPGDLTTAMKASWSLPRVRR